MENADVDMKVDGLPPARVARNLALHMAASEGNVAECEALLNGDEDDNDDNDKIAGNSLKGADDDDDDQAGVGADAWWEDEGYLNWSALHYAANGGHTDVVKLLLRRGALWNAVDETGATAADIAWSYNDEETYRTIFEEGVRQTLLLNLLDRRRHAASSSRTPAKSQKHDALIERDANGQDTLRLTADETADELSAQNERFLASRLTFTEDEEGKMRCLDQDGGLVMAAWETDVMENTTELLCKDLAVPKDDEVQGLRVLNIGFGLGIVDECLQRYKPARHVIVEAHPDALQYAESTGWSRRPGVHIIPKRWEDALDELGAEQFDVIYWDTYAQGYSELRDFFEEVPFLLAGPHARFSFFHGLAGTNRFLYDVYTRVSELDLREMGLDTQWHEVRPQTTSETWNGILRKYWDLDVLRIPISRPIAAAD